MKGNCLRGYIMCIMLTTVLSMVASLCQAQVIELAVGEGITLYTPDPEYPYLDWANALWDSSEAPDMGFSKLPDKYEAHVGINRYFTGTQKITCYFWWTKVSSHGGSVMSPMMTKTWYFKCKGDNPNPGTTPGQDITINSTNFPDANFRNHLLNRIDGEDGVLTSEEIQNLKLLWIDNKNISNLKGIEYFTSLEKLSCTGNNLTTLDVSANSALTDLWCYDNKLTSLNVSNNPNLRNLQCNTNQLTSINVSSCTSLQSFYIYENNISGISMDALINGLPQKQATTSTILFLVINKGSDREHNIITKEQAIVAESKGWYPKYKDLNDISFLGLSIDATNFPDANFRSYLLAQDYGKDGILTEEEINSIKEIDVFNEDISSLKGIEHFTALTSLSCDWNQLTALDISKNTALTNLYSSYNQLTALDVSNNTALGWLECNHNQLTALDVSKNTALTGLSCDNNQLAALDVSKNTALTYLWCDNNQLTALDVSKNLALEDLSCSDNQLTALDVLKNTALTYLWCDNNQLTALDVSKNTALTYLWCDNNQLAALDVSKNTALTELMCDNNQLTALDVSKNAALYRLSCYNNKIKGTEMDKLISSLPQDTTSDTHRILLIDPTSENEGNVCTKSQVAAAKVKGWTPFYYNGEEWVEYEGSDDVQPQSITLPSTETVMVGKMITLTPTITPADAVTTLTWTSDDESIATVSSEGVVTGVKKGQTFINVETDNGKTAVCKLTVTEPEKKVTGITLDKTTLTLEVGKSLALNATIKPDDATNKSVTWSSTKTSVATVDNNGKVTAVAAGNATITCTANDDSGVTATCTVTVKAVPESITLQTTATVRTGQKITLTPTITPADAMTTLTWSSDDESIATVSSEGVVTGVKKGQTFINVETDNGKTAYCKLTVTAGEPTAISLPKNVTVMVNQKITLTPTLTPADAETVLTWKSDDESVVRVSADGVLTGVAEGLALVTVSTSNGLTSGACKVKVEPDTTGISDVEAEGRTNIPVYTLSGQRIDAPRKGINIVGGKKVIIK